MEEQIQATPPLSPVSPSHPELEETPRVPSQSDHSSDIYAVRCRHLISRLDRWSRSVRDLSPSSPQALELSRQYSSMFSLLSQTVDREAWEWLRALPPEVSGPLALSLSESHELAESAQLAIIMPLLATHPPGHSDTTCQGSPVTVTDESIIELARRQLRELVIPNITPFNGDVLQYKSFKSTFTSEVHRLSLSAAKRLDALRSSLRGPPLSIIQNAQSSEEGYAYAWEILDSRYEGRLRIASAIMETFLQFPGEDPSIDNCIAWLSRRQIMLDQCEIPHPMDQIFKCE
uniref:Uncharacterized protein n=1 Tax=Rhodnius prolixus TaxID=13249 RepID=T1I0S9_RHOPR